MTLRRLSILLAAGSLLALAGLGVYAALSWLELSERLQEQRQVSDAYERAERLGNAIGYLTRLRSDPALLRAVQADVRAVHQEIRTIDDAAARTATRHLAEIEHLLASFDPANAGDESEPVTTQLWVHQASLASTLQSMMAELHHEQTSLLRRSLLVFVIGAGSFGLMCVAGFAWVRQRLHRPLQHLEAGIRAQTEGDQSYRVAFAGNDELGRLAAHLNGMAEQRQSDELALRESEERFRQLAENITEVFWLTDPDKTQMLYVSPSYQSVWGRSRESLYADPGQWMAAIHPLDRPRVQEAARHQASGGYRELYRVLRPDGSERWISDRAFPVRDGAGRATRIAGIAEDATNWVTAERALRERMKELRCLYRVLELTSGNQRPLPDVYREITELLPGAMQHEAAAVAHLRIGNEVYRSDGWREPMAQLDAAIRPEGEAVGTVTVGYTSSQEPAAGGEGPFLAEERTLLDGVAAHVARMLHHRRVSEGLEQAQRLEAVGQLTGGVAHDFNNLLTVIIGNAELLKEQIGEDSRLAATASLIVGAAERGAALTHRLLAFARRQPLEPRVIDVNQLVTGMNALLRRTLGEDVEIEFVQNEGLWPAMVDPGQLENALLNLALNARDAMPRGGRLTIETANATLSEDFGAMFADIEAGHYVRIAVTDTGVGIPANQLPRVFEPFFTTKEAGKGTGLGLSMVYGFVKQSGGHVHVYSEPGEGTTVGMYLPRSSVGGDVEAPACDHSGGGGHETILLVEDDRMVRDYARDQLSALGYRVLVAEDARSALALLERHPEVDLLFTDVVMPGGMSGRELAEAAQRQRGHIRVLYTSGYTESAIVHQGRLDPGVRLLSKPYRRADLAASVRRALDADS